MSHLEDEHVLLLGSANGVEVLDGGLEGVLGLIERPAEMLIQWAI